ncbi:hypothetical protein [Curtobacterium sp. Curtsp57]|uniref:hypothetical protein n=1 Tax=Curtobacterium sp. Curtsp57 TaxID=3243047 RepID=UPI0039B5B149
MFEHDVMQTAAALRSPGARAPRPGLDGAVRDGAARGGAARGADHIADARAALDRITSLRSRVADMEATRVDTAGLPTAPALEPLLPGGAIRVGGTYAVPESVLLAMTMLQAASAAGAWCAVVGVPSFGVEAAAAAGIDLERLVLVPDPGDQWLAVTSAMADVAQIVLTRPLGRVVPGDVARLSARLRHRGAALVALGSWPGADVTLRVTSSSWSGIGQGHGHLTERRATVTATGRAGAVRPVSAELLLPAADGVVRAAVQAPVALPGDTRGFRPVAVAS